MATQLEHEISAGKLARDTRTFGRRLTDALLRPSQLKKFLVVFAVMQIAAPALWPVWLLMIGLLHLYFSDYRFLMPLRMPKDLGVRDLTEQRETLSVESAWFGLMKRTRKRRAIGLGAGILYVGYLREGHADDYGRELWLSSSDARTHLFLSGTTGGGKTEALLGISYNAMCWGSGLVYADGKSSPTVAFALWSLARRRGREDDVLILNFLTGGRDPLQQLVAKEQGRGGLRALQEQSNTINNFGEGSADFLVQLLGSLMADSGGSKDGSGKWQEKALNLADAVLRVLSYKRARGELAISISVIQHYLALDNLVKLYLEGRNGNLPEEAFGGLRTYFETGLPGFNPALAESPEQWSDETRNQHGYLSGMFSRTLGMMRNSYGHIFDTAAADIDMNDVFLNNRILIVMIPALEKSPSEAASLGKLLFATFGLTLGQNLGAKLEGSRREVIEGKSTHAPHPTIAIWDEIAFYFAEGVAKQFAQARELNVMMVAGAQDVQGMKRGPAGSETDSLIANTKVKWTLALEDPTDTYDLFRKAGGEGYYSMLSGHDVVSGTVNTGHRAQKTTSIQRRDRIELRELKKLDAGAGLMLFKDALVSSQALYLPDNEKFSTKLAARINRFVPVDPPKFKRMPRSAKRLDGLDPVAVDWIAAQIRRDERPFYAPLEDPTLDALVRIVEKLEVEERLRLSSCERGVVLFEAARRALRKAKEAEDLQPYGHRLSDRDPEELFGEEDTDGEDLDSLGTESGPDAEASYT